MVECGDKGDKGDKAGIGKSVEILARRRMCMRPPGFEPGLEAREAPVLPLDYDRLLLSY